MIVSFEGIDGSGKSTQARLLGDSLSSRGIDVRLVREPGGTPVSERIRELLLDPELHVNPFAEMLLYSAARAQLAREELAEHERDGSIVICDRFFDSTVAYQGGGRQIADPEWLEAFQKTVTGGIVPERTYLLRVSLETALSRQMARIADRMERSDAAFFERVIKAYEILAERNNRRIIIMDGEQPPERIAEAVLNDLTALAAFRTGPGSGEWNPPMQQR